MSSVTSFPALPVSLWDLCLLLSSCTPVHSALSMKSAVMNGSPDRPVNDCINLTQSQDSAVQSRGNRSTTQMSAATLKSSEDTQSSHEEGGGE